MFACKTDARKNQCEKGQRDRISRKEWLFKSCEARREKMIAHAIFSRLRLTKDDETWFDAHMLKSMGASPTLAYEQTSISLVNIQVLGHCVIMSSPFCPLLNAACVVVTWQGERERASRLAGRLPSFNMGGWAFVVVEKAAAANLEDEEAIDSLSTTQSYKGRERIHIG